MSVPSAHRSADVGVFPMWSGAGRVQSKKEIKQYKFIQEMKLELIDKDGSIRIMKDKCQSLEDKLTKQAQEYDTLAEVAGKMFSEFKRSHL